MGSQKARERCFLERFAQVYPEFPCGSVVDSEAPDFLVVAPDQVVGIEVIEYHSRGPLDGKAGSHERLKLELSKQVVNRARREHEKHSDVRLWVSCFWGSGPALTKAELEPLGAELAAIVRRSIPSDPKGSIGINSDGLEGTLLEGRVHSIRVRRHPALERNHWEIPGAAFIGVDPSEVGLLISEKEGKVHQYLRQCDAAWLLIVASGEDIVATGELTPEVADHLFETAFERVVWFDYFGGQAVDLNVSVPRRLRDISTSALNSTDHDLPWRDRDGWAPAI